ncbi:receptor-interacting serine/threonine-protein kinase 3 isoform X2 [Acanthopagrus latus]|uniref:receptor-interacting serine/threonine-protein kinase 3 isoform X2 n=1 Tax=Acanthopagrus latus TaxID=8177 RepID=UPI00187C698C|nr:receptor-interacting serine/threonine-protein kinase 3 isoform X2 [Acanthopagrus latus]
MALSSCMVPVLIEDSSLTDWKVIGSGGFGQIYKARHQKWCCDVAIKLLHHDDGKSDSLLREIDMMRQGSSPHVIQVRGVFRGQPPQCGPLIQLGLVMELMERGSLASLQTLCGTPPWPLVFRLAHQVALGVNFLHSLNPALLHLDLKPSNVLLDSDLNAKLTDFGLARFYHSVTRSSGKDSEEEGGTISYMPPEAFDLSYRPARASDIYSYGILLWSIVTGRQPYANAKTTIVKFRIPQGDRPSLDEIRSQAAGLAGLTGLMNLMEKCWEAKPDKRPSSHKCTTETEELYKMHKHGINDAVHQVRKKLDKQEAEGLTEQVQGIQITQTDSVSKRVNAVNCDNVLTGRLPVQEMAGGWAADQGDKARVRDLPSPRPTRGWDADLSRSSVDKKVKVSSVHPIQSSPPLPSTKGSTQGRTGKPSQQALRAKLMPQFHRQCSSPDAVACYPPPASPRVIIHLSNVTGFQYGSNNTMHIIAAERKRHPTAPPSVDLPPPHSGSRWDQRGGVD